MSEELNEELVEELEDGEELVDIIELTDEEGNTLEFELLEVMPYKGQEYLVMIEAGTEDENPDTYIMRIEEGETEDDETYVGLEDEELDEVFEAFKEIYSEIYNFAE